jgi:hypothetical protein
VSLTKQKGQIQKKNTGFEYEILTQKIFQDIALQKEVKTINLKQNVILPGKSISHQIDVFWEFENRGERYQIIIQTKDWTSRVKQGQLLEFRAVLNDLLGMPNGIFVTRTGYQMGALNYAKKNEILLFELRKPKDSDFKGQISFLGLDLRLKDYQFSNVEIVPDFDWARAELEKIGFKGDFTHSQKMNGQSVLYSEDDSKIGTVQEIMNGYISFDIVIDFPQTVSKRFDNAYIFSSSGPLKRIKISEIKSIITVTEIVNHIEIDLDNIVKFILKNVLNEEFIFFCKDFK